MSLVLQFLFIYCIVQFCFENTFAVEAFKNIGYLGRSYDIFYGSPFSTEAIDPGFRVNIFDYSYKNKALTDDNRYQIPDATDIRKCEVCNVHFSTSTILGSTSYKNSLRVAVSAEFSGFGAAFKASTEFKKMKSKTTSQKSVFTDSKASCSVYCASLFSSNLPKLETHFQNAVARLPKCSSYGNFSKSEVLSFLQEYGTHYAKKVKMGGRFGQKTEFLSNEYAKMSSMGINVEASAGFSSAIASGSLSVATGKAKENAETFKKMSEKQEVYSIGSKIPADGKPSTWARKAIEEPMPIHYKLETLSSLLTRFNFPKDADINCKREAVEKTIQDYCKSLKDRKLIESCSNIDAPDRKLPQLKGFEIVKKDSFEMIWWDKRSGAKKDGSFWIPKQGNNEAAIGALHAKNYNTPRHTFVNAKIPKTGKFIQKAIGWNRIYYDKRTWAKLDGSMWRPKCNSGYASISDFPVRHHHHNPDHYYRTYPCIIKSCLSRGYPRRQWDDRRSGGKYDVTMWTISGGSEMLGADNGKNIGFFRAEPHYNYPSDLSIYLHLKKQCTFLSN